MLIQKLPLAAIDAAEACFYNAQIGFIEAFVFAETNVPINFKQALIDFWNGIDAGCDLTQPVAHGNHKIPGRRHHEFIIIIAVLFKPLFGVVFLKIFKIFREFL